MACVPRTLSLFTLAIAIFISLCNAVFLDKITYDDLSTVIGPKPALLIFTVKWCQHCQETQPEIAVLAKAVKNNPDITVARIDGDEEPAITAKFSVHSYPSFLFTPAGFSLRNNDQPEEFSDYRWAELMAEFVNNETRTETISIKPREKFLKWRKKVPYNRGKSPREKFVEPQTPTPHPDGLEPIHGDEDGSHIDVKDPIILKAENFDETVIQNKNESYLVYFYSRSDPMQRETLLEWRQASGAFTEEDHVTIGMVDVEKYGNEEIAKKYNVEDTPKALYFGRCNVELAQRKDFVCKQAVECESCESTDKIIEFVSEQIMRQAGVGPDSENGDPMELTEEQYEKLKSEGKIIVKEEGAENEVGMKTVISEDGDDEEIKGEAGSDGSGKDGAQEEKEEKTEL